MAETDVRQSSSRSQPAAVRTQGAAGEAGGRPAVDAAQGDVSEPIVRTTSVTAKIERMIGGRRKETARRVGGGEEMGAGAMIRAEGEEGGIEARREASVEHERTRAHLKGSGEASAAMWTSKVDAERRRPN